MHGIDIPLIGAWPAWRAAARRLAAGGVPPEAISWRFNCAGGTLFEQPAIQPELRPAASALGEPMESALLPPDPERSPNATALSVPRAFLELAEAAIAHSDPQRFALLYQALLRLQDEKNVLKDRSDPLIARLAGMAKAVRRDSHKMKAFVRFREMDADQEGRRRFAAWFEPSHYSLERTAPFFLRRFGDMDWAIATPGLIAHGRDGDLAFEPFEGRPTFNADPTEDLWKTYFSSIFNPARLKVKAMTAEMPKKYWRNLPEAELIPDLIRHAEERSRHMVESGVTLPQPATERIKAQQARRNKDAFMTAVSSSEPRLQPRPQSLDAARRQVDACQRCDLHRCATQAVFGEGPANARLMLVGEQPGDREDLAGKPFVGPAGQLMDEIGAEAGLDRSACYVTNAVKHFKFEPRGKRRLHKRPDSAEIQACRWWLDFELEEIRPELVVALGATAAEALTGDGKAILKRRGSIETRSDGLKVLITIHPSSILRIPDRQAAEMQREALRNDLTLALQAVA
ncbi:UdgX family uracil-DNA binding protein [Pseudohoeflea coraliihabitans]|uniref:UdgX family uracil-DNA binding protein n=1 Tax=Pseudohoeflea coraliihabitans TaxID=2860393 RepID=A0ABS6WNB5_9HYPH|nr:UdgX family uracil-DNA binding protein [Pseudohoeflea sp. DP4N28-3]MBW3096600.1 UdgX family uracil-DNA binding protein [Pseudohoeflea sp. DP4N28-3]